MDLTLLLWQKPSPCPYHPRWGLPMGDGEDPSLKTTMIRVREILKLSI